MSVQVRQQDPTYQTLEFYLMVYFTVYPVHPVSRAENLPLLGERVEEFKEYLHTKGTEVAGLPECLPFYALPYIQNPHVNCRPN